MINDFTFTSVGTLISKVIYHPPELPFENVFVSFAYVFFAILKEKPIFEWVWDDLFSLAEKKVSISPKATGNAQGDECEWNWKILQVDEKLEIPEPFLLICLLRREFKFLNFQISNYSWRLSDGGAGKPFALMGRL